LLVYFSEYHPGDEKLIQSEKIRQAKKLAPAWRHFSRKPADNYLWHEDEAKGARGAENYENRYNDERNVLLVR